MGSFDNLPGSGHDFNVSTGPGSFIKKFKHATRRGALANLHNNEAEILETIKQYQGDIRFGKFNRLRQLSAWNKIRSASSELTKDDKHDIKEILKHLGGNKRSQAAASASKIKPEIQKDEAPFSPKPRLKRSLDQQYDFSGLRNSVGPRAEARYNSKLLELRSDKPQRLKLDPPKSSLNLQGPNKLSGRDLLQRSKLL